MPDYSTLCRRARTLQITLPKKADGPLHLVIDSTGLKVYGEGEWKVRQHGYSKRRTWIKLHLAIDPETHEIRAAMVSEPGVTDAEAVPDLLEQVENPIEGVEADGAYDRREVYEELERRGAKAIIPPRRDAKIHAAWQHGGPPAGPGREPAPHPEDRSGGVEGGVGVSPAVAGRDGDVPDEDDLRGRRGEPEAGAAGQGGGHPVPGVEHHDAPGDAGERAGRGVRPLIGGASSAGSIRPLASCNNAPSGPESSRIAEPNRLSLAMRCRRQNSEIRRPGSSAAWECHSWAVTAVVGEGDPGPPELDHNRSRAAPPAPGRWACRSAATSSGVPSATTRPPSSPASGPRSMIQSARGHDLGAVLDDDQRVAEVEQRVEGVEQLERVGRVEAGGRLVEEEEGLRPAGGPGHRAGRARPGSRPA